jgi:alpha-mannosidase
MTNQVIIPFGTDFSFMWANINYEYLDNLKKLFATKRAARKFRFHYSTVDEYFKALNSKAESMNITWPQHKGDFFPYLGVHPGSYWSGYYTSRPNFKKMIRDYTGTI